jgi:thiamine biosynthesis lipoprotein
MSSPRTARAARARQLRLSLGLIAGLAVVAVVSAGGIARTGERSRVVRARYAMGTILEIEALGGDGPAVEAGVAAAFRAVDDVETRLSNWRPESEMSRANAERSRPFSLSPATWGSLTRAFALARETGGAFDPSVGAVTRAEPGRACPDAVGWTKVRLDPTGRTLAFAVPGGAIDTGGFGKGEGLDRALAVLRSRGIEAARLNFGGQISLFGTERLPEIAPVGVAEPRAGSARELARFWAEDGSVSTSSQSERPGHIIDPRTGAPVAFAGSVTVLADTGTRADALSTALLVLGPARGIAFADRRGIAALYVVQRDGAWQLLPSREFPRLRRFV